MYVEGFLASCSCDSSVSVQCCDDAVVEVVKLKEREALDTPAA